VSIYELGKHETYEIINATRMEVLANEISRRAALPGIRVDLVGQPFAFGAYICQAVITSTEANLEDFK
jgi:hypothetical protein